MDKWKKFYLDFKRQSLKNLKFMNNPVKVRKSLKATQHGNLHVHLCSWVKSDQLLNVLVSTVALWSHALHRLAGCL